MIRRYHGKLLPKLLARSTYFIASRFLSLPLYVPQSATVKLRSGLHGRLLNEEADLADILRRPGQYGFKFNRRNNISFAYLLPRTVRLCRAGEHYRQELESGRVCHALKGTPGAVGAPIA